MAGKFALLAEGSPLDATGLRIPVADGVWVTLDVRKPADTALELIVGAYWIPADRRVTARLAVVPKAGNQIEVELRFGGIGQPRPLEIHPVSAPEGRDEMLKMLKESSSGDPLGERRFRQAPGTPLAAREFRIEWPPVGCVRIRVAREGDAQVVVRIETTAQLPALLALLVMPHASNLVSVGIRETKGVRLS